MIDKIINNDKSKCSGCNACGNVCPVNAIIMKEDLEGFYYPHVDESKCIKCKACINKCPILNKNSGVKTNSVEVYACFNKNLEIREKSSSGGFFYTVAEYILNNNGVVYGASFDNKWKVVHKSISNLDEIFLLMGSKYVESYIGNNLLRELKANLDKEKLVLFTGTPCQIGGVKRFLQKDYKNLYTIDFICHGVPSPLVWEKYLETSYGLKNIKNIYFRNKILGWNNFMFMIELKSGRKVYKAPNDDVYMLGFLNDLILRPSCYNCNFKTINRESDFTMADCWGAADICPDINDDKGISAVFIQSEKGRLIFEELNNKVFIKPLDFNTVLKHNTAMNISSLKNKNRGRFFEGFNRNPDNVRALILKYYFQKGLRKKISFRLRNSIKRLLRRIKVGI